MSSDSVWITGVGVVSAFGIGMERLTEGLRAGEDRARPISAFDASAVRGRLGCEVPDLDPKAHFPPTELRRMDRASCLLLIAAREAMASAGAGFDTVPRERSGVSMGSTLGGMIRATDYYRRLKQTGNRHVSGLFDYPLYGPGARVCREFGFLGANLAFSTACSSANVAIGAAADLIRLGKADLMLAGGFDTMAEMTVAGFNILRNVSPERCRPFDRKRQGLVLGEGAGVLVIESHACAERRGARPLARFLGYGMSSDAYHMTAPDVTGRGPARAIEAAIRDAGISPSRIDYVNAHGTGTIHNDAAESKAIHRVLGDHAARVAVSSTKSMHGHALGAAGGIEGAAILAGMQHGFIPPTANFQEADPKCPLDYVPNEAREARIGVALSNNFGFGGNNCSILLENLTDA